MSWLDVILGRTKPVQPDLDALFALPSAAVTLQAATGLAPTGVGSVSYRAAEGGAFATLHGDVKALLGERVEESEDVYGYSWLVVRRAPDALSDLVTELHAVNSSLEDAGFGPSLLCSLVSFADGQGRRLAIVYLYKRGTFYPFAPLAGQLRDNALELQARGALTGELKIEEDLSRWFPVWGAPGL
ncbi:PspA-associated protein PspAB [Nonomuraea dietziae]|uniref:PspA-associated protein PspAB n=1 Tax=Nonomuraea dietziae TaxID=65515 RepID=UPI0033EB6EF3